MLKHAKKETISVCENLLALTNKFGIKLTPRLAEIYEEAYFHDVEVMEDYLNSMASGSPMTGRVANMALFIDSLSKRYKE